MAITTSQNPIDVVSENAGMIILTDLSVSFRTMEIDEANEVFEGSELPLVYLERPLNTTGVIGQGRKLPYERSPMFIYFIYARMELKDHQANVEADLAVCKEMKRQFINFLNVDTRVSSIDSYSTKEYLNFLDFNVSAVQLQITLNLFDTAAIC